MRFVVRSIAFAGIIYSFGFSNFAAAQISVAPPAPPAPKPNPVNKAVSRPQIPAPPANLPAITREQRQQSYAKLLEAQRYLWTLQNRRSAAANAASGAAARAALIKAVELNPRLAEAYAALAELSAITGGDAAEIERAASFAVALDPNNVGALRWLALVYTRQSDLGSENYNRAAAEKAVNAWREIARVNPRSAEAWAFLNEFYQRAGDATKQLEALERWRSASPAADSRFYSAVTGKSGLAPEAAQIEIARLLIKSGKTPAAIELLARAVVDDSSEDALNLLREAIENATSAEAARAINFLQTAVAANPGNAALRDVLIDALTRANRIDEAAEILRQSSAKLAASDNAAAANALVKLGSLYAANGRSADAAIAFENALRARNINAELLAAEAEREFAATVFPALIRAYRNAGETAKAQQAIRRLADVLGANDSTADTQTIELLRFAKDYAAALEKVRELRRRAPEDRDLLRLEAEILADAGKVDAGAALLRSKIVNKTSQIAVPAAVRDDFLAHLAISNLYAQARRGDDAVNAAKQALDLAQSPLMSNIALLTLATAHNSAGDFKSAESTLRDVLRQEPNNATALNNLGYFLVERGERLPEAVELIKRAVDIQPSNASFLDSLGWAYFKINQLAEAEKYLTEAARRSPESATIQDHLGDLYERQGKSAQAVAAWRKALNLTKESAESVKIKAKLNKK